MHAEEIAAECRRTALRQHAHRNAGRVRRDNDVTAQQRLEPRIEVAFRRRLLDDRLDDEITLAEQLQIVFGVADPNQRRAIPIHERRGTRLLRPVEALPNDRVSVVARTRHVQQHHRQPRRRRKRGDPASHRAGPDYSQLGDAHPGLLRESRQPTAERYYTRHRLARAAERGPAHADPSRRPTSRREKW